MVTNLLSIAPAEEPQHPIADPDFTAEKPDSQEHIMRWWDIVTAIDEAPHKRNAIAAQAVAIGIPPRTVKNTYYAWTSGNAHNTRYPARDWRALANRAKYPDPKESNLPGAFIAWVKEIYERHQRETTFRKTYKSIMAALALWERDPFNPDAAIPGYDRPPRRNAFTGHPDGWSESSLYKKCRSNAYEKAARRQGPKRASTFLPTVRTTRAMDADGRALEFGEIIYFDDQDHDNYVNLTGVNSKAMRPQSFNALEALSASCFEVGLKPQLWDEVNGKRRELDQLDFFWFVMLCLTKHGYNAQTGTTLVWEHGKANPDKTGRFDELLFKATNGKVRTDKSGIWRAAEFKSMLFEGKPTGNFRFKAPIESFFNIVRNYSAALPAPTGRNRDLAPEESHGLLAANDHIQRVLIDKLPVEVFLRLKRPVLEWEDYTRLHKLVMDALDARRDHHLEGWKKLGFTGARYRLGEDKPWIDELDYQMIPAGERALYDHIVRQPGNSDLFQLSPREVYMMRRPQLTRLPMRMVPLLAPERAWSDVTVTQDLYLNIEDQWLDSEPLEFIAKVRNAQGYEVHLERGKTYKRLLNIFDPTKLWIAERDGSKPGAYIGVATRVQTASKINEEAILRQLGELKHVKAAESVELHSRMQSEAEKRVQARAFNKRLTNEGAVTPEEKKEVRLRDRRTESAVRFGEICARIEQRQSGSDGVSAGAPADTDAPAIIETAEVVTHDPATTQEENIETW